MQPRRYDPALVLQPRRRVEAAKVAVERDLVLEVVEDDGRPGFCGAVVGWERQPGGAIVMLADRRGRLRSFPLGTGFLLEGAPVTLVPPQPTAPATPARTPSGSLTPPPRRARVARESRIYVEGTHDAELVEKVWGADLREEGVVVEPLGGVDDLPDVVRAFRPAAGRRLGVLVDHLVTGSKESRIVAQIDSPHVLVVGHPFVDVWQAVKPGALGIAGWPDVPRGQPYKEGVLAALGWPPDAAAGWRRIRAAVRGYADLEPELSGRVEELIDFVTG